MDDTGMAVRPLILLVSADFKGGVSRIVDRRRLFSSAEIQRHDRWKLKKPQRECVPPNGGWIVPGD